MDAVVKGSSDVDIFKRNRFLWIHCLDSDGGFQLTVKSFPILNLKCVYGHVSFPSDLMVILPDSDSQRAKFVGVKSPCFMEVKSSAVFDVVPEETEDGKDARIAVIWDFELIQGTTVVCAVQPVEKPADNLAALPRLAFDEVSCNCTNFPTVGDVIIVAKVVDTGAIAQQLENLDLDNDSDEEEDGEWYETVCDVEKATSDEELFTELIQLKGSSYHQSFQVNLKQCKQRMINKESLAVRLHFEPTNVRDENAIVVQVKLTGREEGWQPIGYVPAPKVPKVTVALNNNEVKLVILKNLFYQYIPPILDFRYFPTISVTKSGRWPPNNKNYRYNDKI